MWENGGRTQVRGQSVTGTQAALLDRVLDQGSVLGEGTFEQKPKQSENKDHLNYLTHWCPGALAQCLAQKRGSINICEMNK